MGIKKIPYRRKPWVVTWVSSWTGKRHTKSFDTEAEASAFEQARLALVTTEKVVLKKAKASKSPAQKMTVKALLESYFALSE